MSVGQSACAVQFTSADYTMVQLRKDGPYFWVTWLTKLLTGENSCEWATWFKAHHESGSWKHAPSFFDLVRWQMDHTARLNETAGEWQGRGYTVYTENRNSFVLRGTSVTLGGKPDLVARRGETGVIVDVKTGRPSPSHSVQVLFYMYAVPRAIQQHEGIRFSGQVAYRDHVVDIPADAVDDDFIGTLSRVIRRLALSTPPKKSPILAECGFCNITTADCPERMVEGLPDEGDTEDF